MYTIKLTQYAFDNTYTNARLFDNKAERDAYFENLQGYTFNKDVNFIARDIIATDIDIKVEPNAPLFNLLNYNYCIVKNETETLYFFIRKSEQLSANLIRCRLENDIIQNYLYDTEFSDCIITKAHLNRFIDNGDDTVSFDGNATSKLFEREEIKDLSKRLVYREKLKPIIDTSKTTGLNEWIKKYVISWVYIYISNNGPSDGKYKIYNYQNEPIDYDINKTIYDTKTGSGMEYPYKILCFPILKDNASFIARIPSDDLDFQYIIDYNGLIEFINNNLGYQFIYAIKFSLKPPLKPQNYSDSIFNLYVDNDTLIINTNSTGSLFGTGLTVLNTKPYDEASCFALLSLSKDYATSIKFELDNINIMPQIKFNKNEIVGADKNIKFNPKLNNSDYKTLSLSIIASSENYDIQKMNTNNPIFLYTEMLTIDITKANCKFMGTDNNIFNSVYNDSFNGLTFTNDLSIAIDSSVINQYLANNKNAFLSFQNTQTLSNIKFGVQSVKGLGSSLASFSPSNLAQFGIGFGASMVEHSAQLQYEQAQFNLTIDNMKSAPATIQNSNGNVMFSSAIAEFGIYIEIYEAIPNELEIANNITYDKGFVYNQYDNIKNHINTRKYFNYIQANIENIQADLSNDIKLRMRQIFANGIKFWHTDDIIFNKENYERSLEANG